MGAPNTAQGPAAVRFAPYIKELQEFFASNGLRYGSPEDIVPLTERIESSQPFATDLGSMVRSIVLREGGEMAHSQVLEILALAIGGEQLNHAPQNYGQPLRKLLSFMSGALRARRDEPSAPELPAEGHAAVEGAGEKHAAGAEHGTGTKAHGAFGRSTPVGPSWRSWPVESQPGSPGISADSVEDAIPGEPIPDDKATSGDAIQPGAPAHRGEVLPFPTNPRPSSGRSHGQAAAISAAAERAAHAIAANGGTTRRPPALSFVQRESMDHHASPEHFGPQDNFADQDDDPSQTLPPAERFAYWRARRKAPDPVGELNPPERSLFDPHTPEDQVIEDPDLQEPPPRIPTERSDTGTAAAAFSAGPPGSAETDAFKDAPATPATDKPVTPHTDIPSWQLAAEAARGNRLEPLQSISVAPPTASPAAVPTSFAGAATPAPEAHGAAAPDIKAASAAVGPFHEAHPAGALASSPVQTAHTADPAFLPASYVPRVPRSPAGILVATAAVLVVAGIVIASLQPAPTELTGKHSPAGPGATTMGTQSAASGASTHAKPTAQEPAINTASAAPPQQKLLRVRQITAGDDEDADDRDVAPPYSTPIPGQPATKPSSYQSASGAQGAPSQPAPVIRTSAPPADEVASASVPQVPGAGGRDYSSESYAGGQPGAVGPSGLHPGVASAYRDPDSAIAGDLPRSSRGSRAVVPENPDEVEVSSGIMAGYLISAPRPDYPTLARLAHVGGPVVVQAVVAKNGTVLATHVLSGHRLLRGAAEDAVRRWRFRPYVVDGHPVEVSTIVTLRFKQKR